MEQRRRLPHVERLPGGGGKAGVGCHAPLIVQLVNLKETGETAAIVSWRECAVAAHCCCTQATFCDFHGAASNVSPLLWTAR